MNRGLFFKQRAKSFQRYQPYQRQQQYPQSLESKIKIAATLTSMNNFSIEIKSVKLKDELLNEIKRLFNKIESKMCISPTTWTFCIRDYYPLENALKAKFGNDIEIKGIPTSILGKMNQPSPKIDKGCLDQIDEDIVKKLNDYQKEGVAFGISRNGRVLIADDPGLGKTRQAIAICNYYKKEGPTLIVTTVSTTQGWANEIKLLIGLEINVKKPLLNDNYAIFSYQSLNSKMDDLKMRRFGSIILDESHSIKNSTTQQAKNCKELCRRVKRVIMLSGTPLLSRPIELFSQLSLLDPSIVSYLDYATRYCQGHYDHFNVFNTKGASNLEELDLLLRKTILIRRIKGDVQGQLKQKMREVIFLENIEEIERNKNNKECMAVYKSIESSNLNKDILDWYHLTAELKTQAVTMYLEHKLTSCNEKILIFAHHKIILDEVENLVKRLNISYIRIDGAVQSNSRGSLINKFQNDINCKVAILSITSTNAGITLTASSTVIFCELSFNPSTIIQAEGRSHRIGQTNQVKSIFLLAPKTIDERIWSMLLRKQENLSKVNMVADVEFLSNTIESSFDCKTITISPKSQPKIDVYGDDDLTSKELDEIKRLEDEFLTLDYYP